MTKPVLMQESIDHYYHMTVWKDKTKVLNKEYKDRVTGYLDGLRNCNIDDAEWLLWDNKGFITQKKFDNSEGLFAIWGGHVNNFINETLEERVYRPSKIYTSSGCLCSHKLCSDKNCFYNYFNIT